MDNRPSMHSQERKIGSRAKDVVCSTKVEILKSPVFIRISSISSAKYSTRSNMAERWDRCQVQPLFILY
jgi:hypothetical protein